MEGAADLGQIIINIFKFNSILLSTIILGTTLFGLIIGARGLVEGWELASGDARFSTRRGATMSGFIMKLLLASACVACATIFFQASATMSLDQDSVATNVLNLAQTGSVSGTKCEQFHYSITLIWMIIGTVAWFNGFRSIYRMSNGEQIAWGTPIAYFIGGALCYGVNELASMAAATTGMNIGLENMCKAFGGTGGS